MKTRVVDWIVGWMIGQKISGFNTKVGAAVTIVLAVSSILLVVADALLLMQDGQYSAAGAALNSPAMWLALGGLGITKQMLGVALKSDKNTAVAIAIETDRPELAKVIASGDVPASVVIPPPGGPSA